ncbi:thioredoxin family protein [Halosegnis sp.]|uniref:thioredoxin family protein n=1 Tax=Halosegnis sp. TaxID=2864959 RepID=UPI0035D438CE
MDHELETMRPNPAWTPAGYEESVKTFADLDEAVTIHVWGGDWCKDCRAQLPDFGAALAAAEIPDERIYHYPVEKHDDGSKSGPRVEEYGIERIPTVVIERDGEELARFVEDADQPILGYLADQLRATA